MELQPEPLAEEIKLLRRCLGHLISVIALPAIWSGGEPSQIVLHFVSRLADGAARRKRGDRVQLQQMLQSQAGSAARS